MKKDFTTDRLGRYGDPDGNFIIKGNQFDTPITTKYLLSPTLVTTPDGTTTVVPPGQEKTFNNPYVAEMKLQAGAQVNSQQQQLMQLISMYCQVVGGGDQSCAQKVAASLQKNPEQMVQQMVQTIQQAQQEQGSAEEEQQEQEMARDGGCIDCQEAFPQAQNLNWFYNKAQMGRQVQTAMQDATSTDLPIELKMAQQWLAPQLGGKDYNNALNNMLVSGLVDRGWGLGSSDINRAKEMYKSVYGKDMDDDTMKAMVYRKSKEVGTPLNWATGIPIRASYDQYLDFLFNPPKPTLTGKLEGGEAFPQANRYPTSWAGYNGEQYAVGGEAFPQAQTYLPYDRPGETRFNGMAEYGGQTMEQVYEMMKRGGLNYNPKKKKGGQETFEQYAMRMGGLPKHQGVNQSQVGPNDYEDLTGWQKMRMGVKDFFTEGSGASINVNRLPEKIRDNRQIPPGQYDQLTSNYTNAPEGAYDQLPYVKQKYDPNPGRINQMNQQNQQSPQNQQSALNQKSYINQQAQNNKSGFGPGSQYDLTVQRGIAGDPYAAYGAGRAYTGLGSGFGAGLSLINALGATGNTLFGGGRRSSFKMKDGPRVRGYAADIAADRFFGGLASRMGQAQQQTGSGAPAVAAQNTSAGYGYNVPHVGKYPDMFPYRSETGEKWQGGGDTQFKYTFSDPTQMNIAPSTFSAGVADQLSANRLEEIREQMMNRTAMSYAPITTATKTQAGSPQGAVNAPSFVPFTTEQSAATDAFAPQRQMFTRMGGDILDQFDDDQEVDLTEMSPQEREAFINAIYAAGGSVEYI